MLCFYLFLCFVCPSRDSQPFWVSHQSKWMLSAADASPRQKLIFLCFIIWRVAQVAHAMQWWEKLIFTAVNILHIWIWEVIVVRKIQTRDYDGRERSLVMSVAAVPSCPITKTNIDGKERGGVESGNVRPWQQRRPLSLSHYLSTIHLSFSWQKWRPGKPGKLSQIVLKLYQWRTSI